MVQIVVALVAQTVAVVVIDVHHLVVDVPEARETVVATVVVAAQVVFVTHVKMHARVHA